MKPEEIAQWVIDNRYPKSEYEKIGDAEMYYSLIEKINQVLPQADVSGSVCDCNHQTTCSIDGVPNCCAKCMKPKRKQTDH